MFVTRPARRRSVTALTVMSLTATLLQSPALAATTSTPLTHQCSVLGRTSFSPITEDVQVDAPEEVAVGDTFTVRISPGVMSVDKPVWGLNYRLSIPAPAEAKLVGEPRLVSEGSGLIGGSPRVTTLPPLRQLIVDGGDRPGSFHRPRDPYGWQAQGGEFQFPAIEMTFEALRAGSLHFGYYNEILTPDFAAISYSTTGSSLLNPVVYCRGNKLATVTVSDTPAEAAPTTTTFTDGAETQVAASGGEITLPVQVTGDDGTAVTTGEVAVTLDGRPVETTALSPQGGIAAITIPIPENTTAEPVTYSLTAHYLGTDRYQESSAMHRIVVAGTSAPAPAPVEEVATTTTLAARAGDLIDNATTVAYTLQATVTAAVGTVPDGAVVKFTEHGQTLATAVVSNGVATAQVALGEDAQHRITATLQDVDLAGKRYLASSDTQVVAVPSTAVETPEVTTPILPMEETTITLSAAAETLAVGAPVPLTATVTSPQGKRAGIVVTFRDNGRNIGQATTDASGVATFAAPVTVDGRHTFHAVSADQPTDTVLLLGASSADLTLATRPKTTINNATISLTAAPQQPVAFGDTVTLTATVTPATVVNNAWVSFYEGDTLLADVQVDPATGTASLPVVATATRTLTARLNPGTNTQVSYNGADSAPVTITPTSDDYRFVIDPNDPATPGNTAGSSAEGAGQGSSDTESSSPMPVLVVLVLAILAGGLTLLPPVRQQFNLPPLPPLIPLG
ncbi:hypothetical protein ACFPVT_09810 [Corynebacterium choanae]|uniref:Ig-like domain repeat protein n=1 Tax=Corynebacterium choanae TaxID=1862358 RepID=A0A3G6J823_9CORY|nr:Ig-like domain-containing protein [Corynebacterium choanae]AZA14207.1 hypothetical protein CCHOA_09120 [Corynebacterium choanae]